MGIKFRLKGCPRGFCISTTTHGEVVLKPGVVYDEDDYPWGVIAHLKTFDYYDAVTDEQQEGLDVNGSE